MTPSVQKIRLFNVLLSNKSSLDCNRNGVIRVLGVCIAIFALQCSASQNNDNDLMDVMQEGDLPGVGGWPFSMENDASVTGVSPLIGAYNRPQLDPTAKSVESFGVESRVFDEDTLITAATGTETFQGSEGSESLEGSEGLAGPSDNDNDSGSDSFLSESSAPYGHAVPTSPTSPTSRPSPFPSPSSPSSSGPDPDVAILQIQNLESLTQNASNPKKSPSGQIDCECECGREKTKYCTSFRVPSEPSSVAVSHCILAYNARELTNELALDLPNGTVKVSAVEGGDVLEFSAVSTASSSMWGRLVGKQVVQQVFHKRVVFPPGCMYYRHDQDAAFALERRGAAIPWVKLRLTPEQYALYNVSTDALPGWVKAPSGFVDTYNAFIYREKCTYTMDVAEADVDSLLLTSSLRHAQIRATRRGSPFVVGTLEYTCKCKPNRYGHVAFWVLNQHTSHPRIVLHIGREEADVDADPCYTEPLREVPDSALTTPVMYNMKPFTFP